MIRLEYQLKSFNGNFSLGDYCLQHGLWEETHKKSYFKDVFQGRDSEYPIHVVLALKNGKPIGLGLAVFKRSVENHSSVPFGVEIIGHLGFYVKPEFRKMHIAQQMAKTLNTILPQGKDFPGAIILKGDANPLKKHFPDHLSINQGKYDGQLKKWSIPEVELYLYWYKKCFCDDKDTLLKQYQGLQVLWQEHLQKKITYKIANKVKSILT